MFDLFELSMVYENMSIMYEYYVWELVEIDEDINQMNECACKFNF